ncbi:MAG: hypothetical protein QNJ47_15565 [Nostocaceae cyanobacterium]|nr:hypothetical protein [Nostocaceae cyanobacterium]
MGTLVPEISDLRLLRAKYNASYIIPNRLPITDYRLPITNYQLPITNYQLPITNY